MSPARHALAAILCGAAAAASAGLSSPFSQIEILADRRIPLSVSELETRLADALRAAGDGEAAPGQAVPAVSLAVPTPSRVRIRIAGEDRASAGVVVASLRGSLARAGVAERLVIHSEQSGPAGPLFLGALLLALAAVQGARFARALVGATGAEPGPAGAVSINPAAPSRLGSRQTATARALSRRLTTALEGGQRPGALSITTGRGR